MDLAEHLKPENARRVYTLRVDDILDDLEQQGKHDDAEALRNALSDRVFSSARISEALSKSGIRCSETSVRNWRKRELTG